MAVIQSNNRILRAGEGQGNTYFPGDYIDINENNVISFTGDFSGLSAKVDECCSAVNEEISGIKDDLSGLSSQMEDCCSSVNQNLDNLWSAVNENSANIQINSADITQLSSIVNTKLDANDFNNFRSAYNVTIDELYNHDNYLSGIIDQKLDKSAYHEYSAGDNISIANYVVSGKDWTPTIESAMSSVKGHEYSGSGYISVNNDTDIISLSEVIEPIPWISGWSEIGNVTAEWGQSFRVVSSHDFSGYKNHSIGVKGSWITLPTTANIASALDSKLDTSSFNNFISNEYSTAKNDIINQLYSKQDKSGMSAYVPYSAISGSDNIITGINGSALSAGLNYSAGDNIVINGTTIALDSAINLLDAQGAKSVSIDATEQQFTNLTSNNGSILDASGLYVSDLNMENAANLSKDGLYVTGTGSRISMSNDMSDIYGDNHFEIYGYQESGNGISAMHLGGNDLIVEHGENRTITASYSLTGACSSAQSALNIINSSDLNQYSAGANIDITNHVISGKDWSDEIAAAAGGITSVQSALTANFAFSSNSATYDSDGNVITATYLSSLPDGLVSSVNNLTPTIVSGGINGSELKLSGAWPTGLQLSGQDPIQVTKSDNKVVISITGGVGKSYNVIGGSNTNVATADGSAFTVSSKNWTNDITAASSYAYNQATAAGKTYNVIAGSNINVSTADGTAFTVSGKSWTNDITAASSYAYNQATANAQGKIYTGISPIVVDNSTTTGSISAKMAILSAQSPIVLESSTVDGYSVNTIKYTGTEYKPVVSAMYMTTGYPSVNITPPVTLNQLRITTPCTWIGASSYSAKIDGTEYVMESAAYYDFNKVATIDGIEWAICGSGYYYISE